MAYRSKHNKDVVTCNSCGKVIDEGLTYEEYKEFYGGYDDICDMCENKSNKQNKVNDEE
jgi:DNA-directed RNA polymerase subunit N (RpoN/RPB10)